MTYDVYDCHCYPINLCRLLSHYVGLTVSSLAVIALLVGAIVSCHTTCRIAAFMSHTIIIASTAVYFVTYMYNQPAGRLRYIMA